MKKVLAAVSLVALLCAACITVGRNFPAGEVSRIEIAKTSKADMLSMFGEPYQRGLEDGKETWTYVWIRYGRNTVSKELYVRFLKSGLVDTYSFSTSMPEEVPEQ